MLTVIWIAAILATSAAFPWWLSPILGGLLAAIPLSVLTSRVTAGRLLRERGLMLTPEESREPTVLQAARRASRDVAAASFHAAVVAADTHAQVVAALPARLTPGGAKAAAQAHRVARALSDGPQGLDAADRLRLLTSASALALLRREVLARRAHPDWWQGESAGASAEPTRKGALHEDVPVQTSSRIAVETL
jgi:membrane glycosyltransferase